MTSNKDNSALFNVANNYLEEKEIVVHYERIGKKISFLYPLEEPSPILPPKWKKTPYPYWTWLGFEISQRIKILNAAWSQSKNLAYFEKANSIISDICSWSRWKENDNIRLMIFTADIVSAISDFINDNFDYLDKKSIKNITSSLNEKGIIPLYKSLLKIKHYNWNIPLIQASALGSCSLILESKDLGKYSKEIILSRKIILSDLDRRYKGIDTSSNYRIIFNILRHPFRFINNTLGYTEGSTYDSFSFDYILKFANYVNTFKNDSTLINHNFIREILQYIPAYFSLPGDSNQYAPFDDYEIGHFDRWSHVLSQINNLPLISKLHINGIKSNLSNIDKTLLSNKLVNQDKSLSYNENNKKSFYVSQFGRAALRSGWENNDILIGFKSYQGGGLHIHHDQNNLILGSSGEWILNDSGYQEFKPGFERRFSLSSFGHNTLILNKCGQIYKKGYITNHKFDEEIDYISGDASKCYSIKTGLRKFQRTLFFVKPNIIFVMDEVKFNKTSNLVESLWHTNNKTRIKISGDSVLFKGKKNQTSFKILTNNQPTKKVYSKFLSHGPFLKCSFSNIGKANTFISVFEIKNDKYSKVLNYELQKNNNGKYIINIYDKVANKNIQLFNNSKISISIN